VKKSKLIGVLMMMTLAFSIFFSANRVTYANQPCASYYYTGQHRYTRMTYTHRKYYNDKAYQSANEKYYYVPYADVLMGVCECGAEAELGIITTGVEKFPTNWD